MMLIAISKFLRIGMVLPIVLSGFGVIPEAMKYGKLAANLTEPVIVSDYRLSNFMPDDYEREINAALEQKDPAGAQDIILLAREQSIPIAPELEADVLEANKFHILRAIGDCGGGFLFGEGNSTTELTCSIAGDLTPIGDPRDLLIEISKYPDVDLWNVGFAVTGIAFSAATYLSGGAGAPAKAGLSVLKFAKKSGKLAKGFVDDFEKLIVRSIDKRAVEDLAVAAKRMDFDDLAIKASKLIDRKAINELGEVAVNIQKISGQNGYRVAITTLSASDSIADVKKWSTVSEKFGKKFPGMLKMLKSSGKLVVKITEILGKLFFWLLAGLLWLVSILVSSAVSIWSVISVYRSFRSRRIDANPSSA